MIRLAFPHQRQEGSNACWAAIASSIATFYDPSTAWTQRRLLEAAEGTTFNRMWTADRALELTGNLAHRLERPLTWEELCHELVQERVVVARIRFAFGPGHLIALTGLMDDQQVEVSDPEVGVHACSYADLMDSYRSFGCWTHSYLSQPRK